MSIFPKTDSGRAVLILAAILLLPCACSVKEDRTPCPCYLDVVFPKDWDGGAVGISLWRDVEVCRVAVDPADFPEGWTKPVKKGMVILASWRGIRLATAAGHYLTIPFGDQCDSLYAFHDEVDATGERARSEVVFRKQFATVHLDIRKDAEAMRRFAFLVEGGTCGFDLHTFAPVAGAFRWEGKATEGERIVRLRIPRQSNDSLSLSIRHDGAPAGSFPLGEYIDRLGYDWSTEELQDIYVTIDLVLGLVTVSVSGWEDGAVFHLIEQ